MFGRVFEAGRTDVTVGEPAPGIVMDFGFGLAGGDPRTAEGWVFFPASFNVEAGINGNDDEYQQGGVSLGGAPVTIPYAYRVSLDGGFNYTYCDLDGAGSNPGLDFDPANLGTLTVQ